MQVFEVDDRAPSWESHSPRFRMYVFEGATGLTTRLDFVDARLKDVLDAGEVAERDGRLWSVAAVVDDANGTGLVWLIGMDYDSPPATAAERRARAEMQDRYLARRSQHVQPLTLPDGRRVIRFFVDHGHRWPLWESFADEYTRTPDELGLSADLKAGLRRWYDEWEPVALDDGPPPEWYVEGRRLAAATQKELGDIAEVRIEFE
ncbi:hypothetical protein ACFVWR_07710 [Leifsonia sp. NPDC058292]|uniref:hypothetical protein n=1 Tax=Leifsonia sp. NPDC058292 TaxID=3346428 RepID=UPI0036D7EEEB